MKETRKEKIARQRGAAADRAFDPIRAAIDSGELLIGPAKTPPRCPVHGFLMCEQFDDTPINETATLATPNGTYICYACKREKATGETR